MYQMFDLKLSTIREVIIINPEVAEKSAWQKIILGVENGENLFGPYFLIGLFFFQSIVILISLIK